MTSISFNKYGAQPTTVDGIRFASKREANRYAELKLLARIGDVADLKCHPRFPLVVNGQKVCVYEADFSYLDRTGAFVVEDVKSRPTMTPQYRLKKKLLQALHGITVSEVT